MKKTIKTIAAAALSSGLLLSGVPYNVYASEQAAASDLAKVNEITKAQADISSKVSRYSESLDTESDDTVSVIVQLETDPVAVAKSTSGKKSFSERAVESQLKKEQSSVIKAAKKLGVKLDVEQQYSYVFNGFAVNLAASDIPDLAKVPGVKYIFSNNHYYSIPEVENVDELPGGKYDVNPLAQIGVPEMWASGLTGKGLKVGVIDTGVDYNHPDLKDAFKGGYDSFDNDKDPYEQAPISPEDDRLHQGYEGSSHGTHVSGTIVGRASNPTSDVQVRGIAYEADLYVYRVLGRGGGSSAQVIDGIEKAVRDHMDVINLSLGSDLEKNSDSADSIAVNNAMLAGTITVIANGNAARDKEGQFYYTAGSPAGALLPITVGAVSSPSTQFDSTATSSLGQTYSLPLMSWKTLQEDFASIIGTAPVPVVYANLGSVSDFSTVDVKGKIALISRGTLAFVDKIKNAKDAGAIAVIIYNGNDKDGDGLADETVPGREGYCTFLGDALDAIPTFNMKGTDGWALAKELRANPEKAKSLTFTFGKDYPKTLDEGDKMADFSSRGPAFDGNYSIKPDVSAPGVSILSSVPAWSKLIDGATYEQAYGRKNGTSMATPHIAGLSLLLKEAHPNWTPFDVKAALANTSVRISDEENTEYDVYSQGAGRVDGAAAMKTPAVLQTVEKIKILDKDLTQKPVTNYGDNYSFGLMKAGSNEKTVTLQLKNTSKNEVSYKAEVIMHDSVTTDPYDPKETPDTDNINVDLSESTISADGGDATQFELSLTPSKDAKDGVYEGEVLLKSEDGNPDLHLPFVVHVGEKREDTKFGFDQFKLTNTLISPNKDGYHDTTEATALVQASDINVLNLEAWSLDDTYIGTLASLVNTDDKGKPTYAPFTPGLVRFSNLDGTYVNGNLERKALDPGTYKLRLVGQVVDPSKDAGDNIVNEYEVWNTFGISEAPERALLEKAVNKAAASFKAKVVNTTEVDKAVLELPADNDDVTYAVTRSSNTQLIDKNGVLKEVPKESTNVTLTVTIASAVDESVTKSVRVKVTLEP
ncbi:peptidase [Brevibacillus fluminis]|uniref:Peptidase n=1 Tax=Brevibacillus fluminis TaxID=511487 RepID=A0A3M8DTM4_9BACL|nr:S8 family serine peptidase [Brevibacillus fluminis]RNB91456.1 peptidase [Brevibacillus fluminis]